MIFIKEGIVEKRVLKKRGKEDIVKKRVFCVFQKYYFYEFCNNLDNVFMWFNEFSYTFNDFWYFYVY